MQREKEIFRITIWGAVINILLVIFKFVAGVLGSSAAMIADAVHSLTDLISDAIVLLFARLSHKPADKDHNFGHGKYESLATLILGSILMLASGGILYDGIEEINSLIKGNSASAPGWIALAAALISIALKEFTFQITIRVGKRIRSEMVVANAWHHRTDSISSIGTAIGIGGALLLGGDWAILDAIAAIIVSLFIAIAALGIINSAINQLTDKSLPEEDIEHIKQLIYQDTLFSDLHALRTRRIGNVVSIEMHLRLPGQMQVSEAHKHLPMLEERLKGEFGKETMIIVRIEPIKETSQG